MNEILCTSPTIIKNPIQRYRLGKEWKIIYRDREVKYVPSVNRPAVPLGSSMVDLSIKFSDLDHCYYLNEQTGETIPLYIQVPCGKCIICKNKKAKSWTTRCICETQMYDEQPFFVTLTYNDHNLPSTGLQKRDVQLFMKRFRIRLERQGFTPNIRYVAAAEYGSHTARPHYHVLFWNIPKLTDFSYDLNNAMVASLLQDAWAKRISSDRYHGLTAVEAYEHKDKNGKSLYYERLGFVHVKRAHDNTAGYLAKYIMKEQIIPDGSNPNFMLSSRRHGIGYDYAKEVEKFYKEFPDQTTLEICNKFSNTIHTLSIPDYFKNIWHPTGSKFAGSKYPHYCVLRDTYLVINDMLRFHPFGLNMCDKEIYDTIVAKINDLYPYLTPIRWFYDRDRQFQVHSLFASYHTKIVSTDLRSNDGSKLKDHTYIRVRDYDRFPMWSEDRWCECYNSYSDMFFAAFDHLVTDVPSVVDHDNNMRMRAIFKGSVTQKALSNPQKSVDDVVYELRKEQNRLKINDIY